MSDQEQQKDPQPSGGATGAVQAHATRLTDAAESLANEVVDAGEEVLDVALSAVEGALTGLASLVGTLRQKATGGQ